MKLRVSELTTGIRRGLLATLVVATPYAAPAFAQDDADEAKSLDTISVTGSRIRRVDAETASPVFVMDKAEIERSGSLTIGDLIQDTPSMAGAATNPSVNNGGGDGAATVSLRGLGVNRTLLLLNGHRMVYNDINSIPVSMIERVEILKDGASAIYGSDAIGGVVNFILRRDLDGGIVTANYGISDQDDGERYGSSATFGWSGDRGSLMLSVNYNDQKEVTAADRDYSNLALTLYSGAVTIGGSSRTTTGWYTVPRTLAAQNGITCPGTGANVNLTLNEGRPGTAISDFRCFGSGDLFNYQAVGNLQLTPQERAGLFVNGNFLITDDHEFYVEAYTQNTRSSSQIAPLPFDGRPANDNVPLSADSIYNPFGVDIIDSRLRLSRIGNRLSSFRTDVKQGTFGVRGPLAGSWIYDVNATYGRQSQDLTQTGYLLTSALANALGPSFIDAQGVARCGQPGAVIANCTPVDFFGAAPDPSTPAGQAQLAALAAISTSNTNTTDQTLRNFSANVNGDLFDLPAGPVSAAFGLEYRKQDYSFTPDFLARLDTTTFTCLISSEACASKTAGDFETKEVYGEVFLPLLEGAPFVDSLNASVGVRFSDYDTFGNTTNAKLGIEWRTSEDLMIRATYAEVFRAPTIQELYQGLAAFSAGFTDPCNGLTQAQVNANPNLAQACVNVPRDGSFNQTDSQLSAYVGGNPDLKPEQGDVFTWGVVYDAPWLEGFSTTVDFWRVKLEDTISPFGTQNILNACASPTAQALCELYSRDENGELIRLFDTNQNVGDTETNGVDIGLKYRFDTDYGAFRLSLDSTYIEEYNTKLTLPDGTVIRAFNAGTFLSTANGGLGNYSRWRALGSVLWRYGDFEAQWTQRYVHGFGVGTDRPGGPCADAGSDPALRDCQFDRGAHTYHNLQFGYTLADWNTKIQLGIDNVNDKQPPILYQNNTLNGNTDERTFDTVGRYYWTSVTVNF